MSNETERPVGEQLVQTAADLAADPVGFCEWAFPWGSPELPTPGPRKWQAGVLDYIGSHLRNPATRFQPCRIAVASGHGIGKSALVGQIVTWALATSADCRVRVTAATENQLRIQTWAEITKWLGLSLTAPWFAVQSTSITSVQAGHERLWRADALPWNESNSQAFGGLHNFGKRIVVVFDEASTVAPTIWEVTEGTLTDENTEIIWLAFGNPEQPSGRFFECFGSQKHRWHTLHIDSRTVEGTNAEQARQWVEDWGEDHDFVRVRVRGEFPRHGLNSFIPASAVDLCRQYECPEPAYSTQPKILAVDVARAGDDQTVLCTRQGRKVFPLEKFRGLSIEQTSAKVFETAQREQVDATVIDGVGLGIGVYDNLHERMRLPNCYEFNGGRTAFDASKYFNRRAETWAKAREALLTGQIDLPREDAELAADLVGPKFTLTPKQQIQLERKEDMKRRGLSSPDCGDALTMTWAVTIAARQQQENPSSQRFFNLGGGLSEASWMR